MTQPELLRLQRVEVDRLFGVYDHRIDLNLDERVTLLHGPNGVGKTSILRMVDALLSGELRRFRNIPFARFALGFDDGSTIKLEKPSKVGSPGVGENALRLSGSRIEPATVDLSPKKGHQDELFDRLVERLGELPPPVDYNSIAMEALGSHLRNTRVHLIGAERLARIEHQSQYPLVNRRETVASVLECSRDYHARLDDTMAAYGRHAQTLDQSFPQRLLAADDSLGADELREQMEILDRKTAEYQDIGLLDAKPDSHPFDFDAVGSISDATQARVMTLYVQDTAAKLDQLEDFADRTRLFLQVVNRKYRHKQAGLDRDKGIVASGCDGEELPLEALSSGEQHEFVLNYDLLFRVAPNTVVLVDEPELSLHVAWQKRFLADLLQIVKLSEFDAIIATHSPFIAGVRDDLMVDLDG